MSNPYWITDEDGTYKVSYSKRAKGNTLPAGMYEFIVLRDGSYWIKAAIRDDEIIRFPGSPADDVMNDITTFWERADRFAAHGLPHKRGVLLFGPPGSGKTFTLQLVARDVIDRGGIVLLWTEHFRSAYRSMREVEPDRPLVVLMEDLDGILGKDRDVSDILNILDGAEKMNHVVFVASTNYPEQLQERITNRPSRFDRKVYVPHPPVEARRMYLETLLAPGDDIDLDQWAKDTQGFSMAHLKELHIGVCLLGNDYGSWLKQLKAMSSKQTSADGEYGGQYV